MTLLLYSIAEKRWIRPHHVNNNANAMEAAPVAGAAGAVPVGQGGNGAAAAAAGGGAGGFMGDPSIIVQGTPPPGRNGHSATLAADPDDNAEEGEENGRIIIIGGWLGTGPLAASDMHILDVSAGGRQLRWYQPAVKGTPPGPCNMHSADYVPRKRSVYVFRGGNGREYLNDLHALNVDTLTWHRVDTTGEIPQQRANHSSALLEETGELFIFGGWNGVERLNDIHILDTDTSNWTCPRVGGVLPHPRAGMTLTALQGRLFLFGGSGTSAKCFHDLQILDREKMAWLDVTVMDETNQGGNTGSNNGSVMGGQANRAPDMAFGGNDDNVFRFGGSNAYDNHAFVNPEGDGPVQYGDDADASAAGMQQGGTQDGVGTVASGRSFTSSRADWRSRDLAARPQHHEDSNGGPMFNASPNPNDEDTVPSVLIHGRGPGRRAGHTATAVNRKIYVFGGSCGSDYLNDFFVLDTDPRPKARVSEPASLQLIERRLRHFFNDEEFSDVTFVVQGQRVYGHKMVLSIVSDCFRAMFTTGFRESEAMEIEIPDCSHAAFLSVMEYIYTGLIPRIDLSQDQDRNLGRIVEMLELADRFFLDHLKQVCETMLEPTVCTETAEYLLGVSQKTNAKQLQAICEHFLRNREGIPSG